MNNEIIKIFKDRENSFYPKNENAFEKIKCKELNPGQKIHWYYKDDVEYAKEWIDKNFDMHSGTWFLGIIMPFPEIELSSNDKTDLDPDDCIVVVTEYPCEKEYCRCGWIYLNRLLEQDNIIEIY